MENEFHISFPFISLKLCSLVGKYYKAKPALVMLVITTVNLTEEGNKVKWPSTDSTLYTRSPLKNLLTNAKTTKVSWNSINCFFHSISTQFPEIWNDEFSQIEEINVISQYRSNSTTLISKWKKWNISNGKIIRIFYL